MAAVVLGGAIASLYAVRADSSEQTVAAAVSNTSPLFPSSFPIAVWLQNPDQTTKIESGYSTLARAAAAEGINTFLGLNDWPSAFGVDNSTSGQGAQFQAACNAGEHVVAGGNSSSNTAANSVASVEFIAALERQAGTGTSCSQYLAGYDWTDEPPACSNNVAAQVAAIHAEDPTRPTIDNMASWVSWGDSGCTSSADAAFAAPAITSSDDYHNTDAWNVTNAEGGCEGAQHVSTSPWADCSWLYGYQAAVQASLSGGKPTWVFLETGTDELGFSSQSGSSCNIVDEHLLERQRVQRDRPPGERERLGGHHQRSQRHRVVLPRRRPGAGHQRLGLHGRQRLGVERDLLEPPVHRRHGPGLRTRAAQRNAGRLHHAAEHVFDEEQRPPPVLLGR